MIIHKLEDRNYVNWRDGKRVCNQCGHPGRCHLTDDGRTDPNRGACVEFGETCKCMPKVEQTVLDAVYGGLNL